MDPKSYIGKLLADPDVPAPAAVLDRAAVQRNCARMLGAARALQLGWRAHIKTHKTTELTRLQVGDNTAEPVQIVVSTLLEGERILPLLQEYQARGRTVSVLYGFPLYAAALPRLAAIARALAERPNGTVAVIIDHPDQVAVVRRLAVAVGSAAPVHVFLKVDMGSHRSGVIPGSPTCAAAIRQLLDVGSASSASGILFHGLYCHAGHSYDARKPWAAMATLVSEFAALGTVADEVQAAASAAAQKTAPSLTLSVGASPTAATLQHPELGGGGVHQKGEDDAHIAALRATLDGLRSRGLVLEVHAGVQPVLDLQQLATHSWGGDSASAVAETDDLALTVLADVASIYPGRGARGHDEVLVNAGCLALARESVKDVHNEGGAAVYTGFGIVKPWGQPSLSTTTARLVSPGASFPKLPAGSEGWWQVSRISQEHGIMEWAGGKGADGTIPTPPLGQRLQIWPNHACITASAYSYFLVVDGDSPEPTKVVDVWERWSGW